MFIVKIVKDNTKIRTSILGCCSGVHKSLTSFFKAFCTVHLFSVCNEKPTDVTISILFIYRRISTCFGPTGPSSREFTQLFTQPLVLTVSVPFRSRAPYEARDLNGTDTVRISGCVNSCVNSPEDGPVGPKHVEIRRYMNKIEIVTSVGFSLHILNVMSPGRLNFVRWLQTSVGLTYGTCFLLPSWRLKFCSDF